MYEVGSKRDDREIRGLLRCEMQEEEVMFGISASAMREASLFLGFEARSVVSLGWPRPYVVADWIAWPGATTVYQLPPIP